MLEVVHVLSSPATYRLPRSEVSDRLRKLLQIRGLLVPHAQAFWEAAGCFESSGLDFVDCLNVSQMKTQGITEIVSFDRDFDRFPDIIRIEP